MVDPSRALEIEEHALLAWPAEEVELCAGWQLRAMHGVSRRANSVWTGRATGDSSTETRIAYAESFYAARGLPASFQVGDQSEPTGLDAELARRGYGVDAPVSVQVASVSAVAAAPCPQEVRVDVGAQLNDTWFELSARRGRFASVEAVYRGLLLRLGAHALFATAFIGELPVAVGLGVRAGNWLGISSMFTLPEYRGRGAARSVLRALASEVSSRAQPGIYLQVERDNTPAFALYASVGFAHHHGYHYRVRAPMSPHPG